MKTFLTSTLALLALTPSINALGCYSDSGLAFNELHGGKNQEIMGEVFNDINTQCQIMDGLKFHKSLGYYKLCTEWAVTVEPLAAIPSAVARLSAAPTTSTGSSGTLLTRRR